MVNKKQLFIIKLCIAILCLPLEINAQNLSGVWSGKYSYEKAVYKYEVELSYDKTHNLYIGMSHTKRTSYDPNNLFPSTNSTYLIAKENKDVLSISEIALESNTTNAVNYSLMVGEFKISIESNLETFTGSIQYRLVPQIPITLTKTKSEPSEKAKNKMLEALSSLKLSSANFKAPDGSNKVYENSSGELFYSVSNSSQFIFKDIVSKVYFDQKPSGVTIPGLEWVESGMAGDISYMNGQSKSDKFIFSTSRDIPQDSLSGILCIQTRNKIILQQQRFSMPTVKLIKKNDKADSTDWNSNERLKLIASYYGISNYKWNIKAELEKLIATGDKKALMWKALFLHLGQAGYEADEQLAFGVGSKKGLLNYLDEQYKAGDIESMFLKSVALMMNLQGSHREEEYEFMLRAAAEKKFAPAQYMLAVKRLYEKKYNDSKYYFQKALTNGIKIANLQLGIIEENGWNVPVNITNAIAYYEKAALLNNPDALLRIAAIHSSGNGITKDNKQALKYLLLAVKTGFSSAKLALADYYLKQQTNKSEILTLTKQAADNGNRHAIFQLALLNTYPQLCGLQQDDAKAIQYLKTAAELGEPHAMHLLGMRYFTGNGLEKNFFIGRFWISEASRKGVGEAVKDAVSFGQPLMAFVKGVCSYVPDIIVETRYYNNGSTSTTKYNDPNPIPFLEEGIISLLNEVHQQRQPTVDDIRLIYRRGNLISFGAMMTTGISLKLMENDVLNIYASGKVSLGFGTVLQNIGPDGMEFSGDYRIFSRVRNQPHGSIIATGDYGDTWGLIGKSATAIQNRNNNIIVAINDADYTNNQGYFNLRFDIFRSDSTEQDGTASDTKINSTQPSTKEKEIENKVKKPVEDVSSIKYKRLEHANLSKGIFVSIRNYWKGTYLGLKNSQAVCDSNFYRWLKIDLINSDCFYLVDPETGLYLTGNKKGEFMLTEFPEDKSIWQLKDESAVFRIRNINMDKYLNIENGPIVCGKIQYTWHSAMWSFVY